MVIVVRADLGMSAGKIAAQSVHAALAAYRHAQEKMPSSLRAWEGQGAATICLQCSGDEQLQVRLRVWHWHPCAALTPALNRHLSGLRSSLI
jgi:peptidyl-tRNA hydrolase